MSEQKAETKNLGPDEKYFARLSVAKNTETLDEEWQALEALGLQS